MNKDTRYSAHRLSEDTKKLLRYNEHIKNRKNEIVWFINMMRKLELASFNESILILEKVDATWILNNAPMGEE